MNEVSMANMRQHGGHDIKASATIEATSIRGGNMTNTIEFPSRYIQGSGGLQQQNLVGKRQSQVIMNKGHADPNNQM